MDLADRVREEHGTALDRLGSEKSLLALTDAQLETEAVLEATGAVLASAQTTVAEWAADADDDAIGDGLETAAAALADARDRVAADFDGDLPAGSDFVSLAAEGDAERAGAALVGLPLVLDCLFLQGVSFFVNEADTRRADLFRDLREVADDLLALAEDLALDGAAADAAGAVVVAAYETYVERLEAMGFDPKPIC